MKTVVLDQCQIDRCGIDEVEHTIAPPMEKAITLPIKGTPIVIYVAVGGLTALHHTVSDERLREVAQAIANKLEN